MFLCCNYEDEQGFLLFLQREMFLAQDTPTQEEKADMALASVQEYLKILPVVKRSPQGSIWSSYEAEDDVLYVNFRKPSQATDSELTDDDVILRYNAKRSLD